MKSRIAWGLAAVVSGAAAWIVVHHGTPIDRALPLIAVVVTVIAAVTRAEVELAVPLLIGCEIAIPDERLRLTAFGVVLGMVFWSAAAWPPQSSAAAWPPHSRAVVAFGAIVLLRWIPFGEVLLWRELLLIALALAIVAVFRFSALGVAVAVAAALFTPAIPLRTFALPVVVLVAAFLLRRIRAEWVAGPALAIMMVFFAWSGAFARALPLLLRGVPAYVVRVPVATSVGPGDSLTIEVPPDATAVILSGANVPRLRRGALLGYVDQRAVRIGDVADWGVLRRDQFYASRNPLPNNAAGLLRGYGQTAWIDGAGRVPIRRGTRSIRVVGAPTLAFEARLQIDGFELEGR